MWLWHVKTAEVLSLLEIKLFPVYEGCWGTSIRRIRPDINKCFHAVPCDGRAAMEDMEAWASVISFLSCFLTPLIIAISKHQLGLSVSHATWKSMICAHWQSWYFFAFRITIIEGQQLPVWDQNLVSSIQPLCYKQAIHTNSNLLVAHVIVHSPID